MKDLSQGDSRHLFQLTQSKQSYMLAAETEELKQRWMQIIKESARGNTWTLGEDEEDDDSFDEVE